MASVQELQARLEAIRKARDSGVLIVRHGDESTEFRSLADMNVIINDLQKQIDSGSGTTPRSRVNYITQNDKGY